MRAVSKAFSLKYFGQCYVRAVEVRAAPLWWFSVVHQVNSTKY